METNKSKEELFPLLAAGRSIFVVVSGGTNGIPPHTLIDKEVIMEYIGYLELLRKGW